MKTSATKTIIKLTKIKQWWLPVDAESYKVLRDAGVPLIRIHENFIPTLGLITKSKNIKAQTVDFKDSILHPYLDEVGARWKKKQYRVVSISSSVLKFETTHQSIYQDAKEALVKVETSLRRFFTRWGYNAVFEQSESRGKHKLHVSFKYDSNKMPIIMLTEDTTSMPAIRLELGFLRISMIFGERELETNISIAAGSNWTSLHTSRCLYSQVSDIRPMITSLMSVVNRDEHNFDNKAK